jgi:hypothetical protein
MVTTASPPIRSAVPESNSTSAREFGPVEMRSLVTTGALTEAATHSPESPRCTETSPFTKLIRATPRFESSGSTCARTGLMPPISSATPAKLYNHLRRMTFTQLPLLLMAWQGPKHKYLTCKELIDEGSPLSWPKTTSLVFFNHAVFNHAIFNHATIQMRGLRIQETGVRRQNSEALTRRHILTPDS